MLDFKKNFRISHTRSQPILAGEYPLKVSIDRESQNGLQSPFGTASKFTDNKSSRQHRWMFPAAERLLLVFEGRSQTKMLYR